MAHWAMASVGIIAVPFPTPLLYWVPQSEFLIWHVGQQAPQVSHLNVLTPESTSVHPTKAGLPVSNSICGLKIPFFRPTSPDACGL